MFTQGQLADSFGRRKVFFIVYAMFLLVGFMTSFANSWELYAAGRLLVGALFGGKTFLEEILQNY